MRPARIVVMYSSSSRALIANLSSTQRVGGDHEVLLGESVDDDVGQLVGGARVPALGGVVFAGEDRCAHGCRHRALTPIP
jgi:hypothetical protein